ncbi:hypothetical protein [Ilumatobacter coccineus]|uniref:Uncharacterized protein n=1 Tax=Ilumatobacter coccineus (strain NBRC 103263 / KCTC 29153 / YM16-304) TaxID=1313172 RepID=A0A6C7EC00_ILUCY|nr:hypothetical protein [Ilumatobacter coccineus]BAN02168.1 hypothetical protein YM304_18540 [Ilumatobacter coccineus YM16-304]
MRFRSIAIGMTLLVSGTSVGAATQQFATAGTSSGNRPVLIPITPCRLADTRPAPNTVGPRSAPLAAVDTMTVDAQEPGTDCSGMIPADANGLSLNITALNATASSYLTVWPGGDRPTAASLNPSPGQPPVPNAVTTALSVDHEFEVYNNAGNVDIVVDVNGYYVDHDHDDRYYPRSEIDEKFAAQETDSIHLSSAAFTPVDDGWDIGRYGIYRVDSVTGDRCAVADLQLPPGATITRIDVSYLNFDEVGPAPDLDFIVSERRPLADRTIIGIGIAGGSINLPVEPDELEFGIAGLDVRGRPALPNAAHQVSMCTSGVKVFVDSVHLTL